MDVVGKKKYTIAIGSTKEYPLLKVEDEDVGAIYYVEYTKVMFDWNKRFGEDKVRELLGYLAKNFCVIVDYDKMRVFTKREDTIKTDPLWKGKDSHIQEYIATGDPSVLIRSNKQSEDE